MTTRRGFIAGLIALFCAPKDAPVFKPIKNLVHAHDITSGTPPTFAAIAMPTYSRYRFYIRSKGDQAQLIGDWSKADEESFLASVRGPNA